MTLSRDQQRLFDEAAHFEIRYGLTIPLHGTCGEVAALTFAASERSGGFQRQGRLLQLMAMYFHAHARRKLVDGAPGGIVLSPRERECLRWAAEGKSC